MFAKRKAARQAREEGALHAELTDMLMAAQGRRYPATPIVLKSGEHSLYVVGGAGLFETRKGPGHWAGRSSGISVPVGGGIRVRAGASRGHFVQGDENPTIIDTGTVTFTTARVVFTGPRYTREWDFDKLIAVQHFVDKPWTAIQVSNRQKTSGFTYEGLRPDFVHARLEMALSINQGEGDEVIRHLQQQLSDLDGPSSPPAVAPPRPESLEVRSPPTPTPPSPSPSGGEVALPPSPPAPPPAGPPPAWYPDPAGASGLRWWDGTRWTSYTAAGPTSGS